MGRRSTSIGESCARRSTSMRAARSIHRVTRFLSRSGAPRTPSLRRSPASVVSRRTDGPGPPISGAAWASTRVSRRWGVAVRGVGSPSCRPHLRGRPRRPGPAVADDARAPAGRPDSGGHRSRSRRASAQGHGQPERIYQLAAPGLTEEFPVLKTASSSPFEGREGALAEAASAELARHWRRPGRRTLIVATFAAAAIGATAGVLLTQGGGTTAGAGVAADAVGVIDPNSAKVVSDIPIGSAPAGVAVGLGSVWVANTNDNTVTQIELATNTSRQTINVGAGPVGVAVGGGAVWVANELGGRVPRIDPATNRVVDKVRTGNGPSGVAYGERAVWVTNSLDGTVTRITRTGKRPRRRSLRSSAQRASRWALIGSGSPHRRPRASSSSILVQVRFCNQSASVANRVPLR